VLRLTAFIFCDEIEIEQVVVNLINNAIDAVKDLPERWIKNLFITRTRPYTLKNSRFWFRHSFGSARQTI